MEPDPSPDSSLNTETQITNKDIDSILGLHKKVAREHRLYGFAKQVIVFVASITTFILISFYLFQQA